MTLTAPGCGMGAMIAADAKQKIMALEGVGDATVDLVWEPGLEPEHDSPKRPNSASASLKRDR